MVSSARICFGRLLSQLWYSLALAQEAQRLLRAVWEESKQGRFIPPFVRPWGFLPMFMTPYVYFTSAKQLGTGFPGPVAGLRVRARGKVPDYPRKVDYCLSTNPQVNPTFWPSDCVLGHDRYSGRMGDDKPGIAYCVTNPLASRTERVAICVALLGGPPFSN